MEYVVKHLYLPYTSVFCRFDLSITQYNGRCQRKVVYISVVRRCAPPSNCDVTKARISWRIAEAMLNFEMINIAHTTKTIGDFVTSFWPTKAVVMSHFAAITLTDFLAKARLLDRDVNFICR